MDLSTVIIGAIATEKAETLKSAKVYTLHIANNATKVDVKKALKKFYDVDALSVRVLRTRPKVRTFGRGNSMEKRHRSKRAIVTLDAKSKALDLASFKTS